MSEGLVLGLDCGQTACKAVMARPDGTVLAAGRGGAIEHLANPEGVARSGRSVTETLLDLKQNLGAGEWHVAVAAVGFSGITPAREEYVRQWIQAVFPTGRFLILGDAPVNLAGAGNVAPETVVVIAGGGSVAWAACGDGTEIASGGWAHMFGDEGSGWWIGREACIAALRAQDGRGPDTWLEVAVAEHFGVPVPGGIKELYYSHRVGDPDIARLVPVVARVADAGDRVAAGILARAGHELGTAAAALIRRMGKEQSEPEVVATGGVFKVRGLLWNSFCTAIRETAPRARIRQARFDPVIGAVLLALRELHGRIDDTVYDQIESSLRLTDGGARKDVNYGGSPV